MPGVRRQMARINLDSSFFGDPRIEHLGILSGEGKFAARGRIIGVWHYSYEQMRDVLTALEIDQHAGWFPPAGEKLFGELLVQASLAEPTGEGSYRIKGARPRYQYLVHLRENAKRGGQATKARWQAKRGPAGLPSAGPDEGPLSLVPALSPDRKYKSKSASADDPMPDFKELWNTHCGSLPNAKALTTKRKSSARARWRDMPDEAYWINVVQRIASSLFCNGESDRGWRATFDFFLKPDTHISVMEGKYDGVGGRSTAPAMAGLNGATFASLVEGREN